jgi:alpha-glucosidase
VYLLTKRFHPLNFVFAERYHQRQFFIQDRNLSVRIRSATNDIHHIEIYDLSKPPKDVRVEKPSPLQLISKTESSFSRLEITPEAGIRLSSATGAVLLEGESKRCFGQSGPAWLFQFKHEADMSFYGLGEKQAPFERSGQAYTFYNIDAWADHPREQVRDGDYDPDYISIPYLIIKRSNTYLGLLLDCPYPAMISISSEVRLADQLRIQLDYPPSLILGAEDGIPSLYCILGPSLAELTCKLQKLTGTTPLPPLWALGYQQSRWGYRGDRDLFELADRFEEHEFPVDGLWLDIDYMDNFRVFTFDGKYLPNPAKTVAALLKRGFRVVPILDPGVKRDENYPVYIDGKAENIFCLTEAGVPFVGMVWAGFTVFPDFSLPEARQWWSRLAEKFFDIGFEGAWIDMNDPSTGPVDPTAMRFEHGTTEHTTYHNQYALLMAMATRNGLLESRPGQRPFLLSRSGSTGSQKYAAHWTGDNFSNYHHLHCSIGKSLNLALSGIPFNGADVGGFGGDCQEQLLIDWVKCAFLFPFFRNHTMRGSRSQEPWAYSGETLKIFRRYVRLRYHLMPYLYNLFMDQEENGQAILRPLFYDFPDSPSLPLSHINDQFMVGPSVMQAPFIHENLNKRKVILPEGQWLDGETGLWVQGACKVLAGKKQGTTPIYFREGSLIPFQPSKRVNNRHELNHIGLFCCIPPEFKEMSRYIYRSDDGISFDYQKGGRSSVEVVAWTEEDILHLRMSPISHGYGPITIIPFTIDRFAAVIIEEAAVSHHLHPEELPVRLSGNSLKWYRWVP